MKVKAVKTVLILSLSYCILWTLYEMRLAHVGTLHLYDAYEELQLSLNFAFRGSSVFYFRALVIALIEGNIKSLKSLYGKINMSF